MLKREECILLVVDLQDKLMPPDSGKQVKLFEGARRIIQVAKLLRIPVLVTEQNPDKLGTTSEKVIDVLNGVQTLSKMEFSALGNSGVCEAVKRTGRKQIVIIGVETHICVLQTALGAVELGYTPYIVRDAIGARQVKEHEAGLARMYRHGVAIVTVEMAIFEWLRMAGTKEFREVLPLLK